MWMKFDLSTTDTKQPEWKSRDKDAMTHCGKEAKFREGSFLCYVMAINYRPLPEENPLCLSVVPHICIKQSWHNRVPTGLSSVYF